jgi:hypothetical protein
MNRPQKDTKLSQVQSSDKNWIGDQKKGLIKIYITGLDKYSWLFLSFQIPFFGINFFGHPSTIKDP